LISGLQLGRTRSSASATANEATKLKVGSICGGTLGRNAKEVYTPPKGLAQTLP